MKNLFYGLIIFTAYLTYVEEYMPLDFFSFKHLFGFLFLAMPFYWLFLEGVETVSNKK